MFQEFAEDLVAHGDAPARIGDVCMDLSAAYQRGAAERYLGKWCRWVRRIVERPRDPAQPWALEAMHRTVETLRAHARGILNYFRLRLTSGVIEAVNGLAQAARACARGYRHGETFTTMIYLLAGRLRFELTALFTHYA